MLILMLQSQSQREVGALKHANFNFKLNISAHACCIRTHTKHEAQSSSIAHLHLHRNSSFPIAYRGWQAVFASASGFCAMFSGVLSRSKLGRYHNMNFFILALRFCPTMWYLLKAAAGAFSQGAKTVTHCSHTL